MVPPYSDKVSRASPYSLINILFTFTGLSPYFVSLSILFKL